MAMFQDCNRFPKVLLWRFVIILILLSSLCCCSNEKLRDAKDTSLMEPIEDKQESAAESHRKPEITHSQDQNLKNKINFFLPNGKELMYEKETSNGIISTQIYFISDDKEKTELLSIGDIWCSKSVIGDNRILYFVEKPSSLNAIGHLWLIDGENGVAEIIHEASCEVTPSYNGDFVIIRDYVKYKTEYNEFKKNPGNLSFISKYRLFDVNKKVFIADINLDFALPNRSGFYSAEFIANPEGYNVIISIDHKVVSKHTYNIKTLDFLNS